MTLTLRRMSVLVGLAVLLVALIGCQETAPPGGTSSGSSATPAPTADTATAPTPAANAKAAEDFTLNTLDGKKITLASLKGKPVLVVFWASWCHYCAQEAPDLEALYQQYHPKGLEVLGVGTDDTAALGKKAKELKLTYPIGSNPEAAKAYGVGGIPHVFMINRKGEVTASLKGARPKEELEAEIKKVM